MLIKDLYEIKKIEKNADRIQADVHLNKDHEIFKGHFPGNPVMPGVCMIQMIKELTEKELQKELFLVRSTNIKFMAIINPEKNPDLSLSIDFSEEDGTLKIRNTTTFEDTVALKLNAIFKII